MRLFIKKYGMELLISGLGIIAVVAFFWLPFGLKTTDFADGWINIPKVERANNTFSMVLDSFENSSRPLVFLPWRLGYLISKDSFMGVGFVLAMLFIGKGLVFYWILRKLNLANPPLAFLMAVLFILYPADQGNFLMRALGRHFAVFFYYLAVLLLILASRSSRLVYLVGMLVAEGISAFTAEQGYLLIFITPLLLWLIKECSNRKKIVILASWYGILFMAVVDFLLSPREHQGKILTDGLSANIAQYIKEVVLSNFFAYRQFFIIGWLNACEKIGGLTWQYGLYGFGVMLVTIYVAYLLARLNVVNGIPHLGLDYRSAITILVGFVIVGLTFFPYSLTSFRYEYSRVFYYAAAGGALVLGVVYSVLIQFFHRSQKIINFIFFGLLIFVASINGFMQRARFVVNSQNQQHILINIVEQAPFIKPGTTIVLLTGEKRPFTKIDFVFQSALNWAYKQEHLKVLQCSSLLNCSVEIPYETSMVFEYKKDGDTYLLPQLPEAYQMKNPVYQPYKNIMGYVPFPDRAQNAFDIAPAPQNLWPQDWVSTGQTLNDRKVCDLHHYGDCSLFFYNDGIPTNFSQMIETAGNENEKFELSYWSKAGRQSDYSPLLTTITIMYTDGTKEKFEISRPVLEKWNFYQLNFKPKKPYLRLLLNFHSTATIMIWLDDVSLLKNGSQVFISNPSFEK